MNFLDIQKNEVQQFLWEHLVPTDIRYDHTKFDAMKSVTEAIYAGTQWLVGDLNAPLVFRCVLRNPKVLECHIMGNAARLRSLLPAALEVAWARNWGLAGGIERISLLTVYSSIARICVRLGFSHEATLPRAHWNGTELQDLHVITLERP